MEINSTTSSAWSSRLREFARPFLIDHPLLRDSARDATILLHGSTTQGIDDAHSDLDVWLLLPGEVVRAHESIGGGRFIEFKLDGKPGHFSIEPVEEFFARIDNCDFPLIAELRIAEVLHDPDRVCERLLAAAGKPMRSEVQRAWFRYHYVEMRSDHRACDTPIEREMAASVLLALTPTIAHALRAACVLDGLPYPYIKWLPHAAGQTPTGAQVLKHVEEILDLLGTGALRLPGPEKQYPLSAKLRDIRNRLIECAGERGINEPWLREWWLSIPASRAGIQHVKW